MFSDGGPYSCCANGAAHVCFHPATLDSRAMIHRLSIPPRTVQVMPVVLREALVLCSDMEGRASYRFSSIFW